MRKIKWGILATGKIAHKFVSDIKWVKDAEVIAVASRDIQKGEEFAREFKIPKAYGNYKDLANDPDVDVIYIATPHTFHFENTLMCLEAGKHVLCEKPIGMNSQQLVDLMNTAREKHLFLMEALWTRFLPSYLKFRELILNGSIGEVRMIQSDFGFISPNNNEHRLRNRKLGGGSLLDIGIYPVFLALDIAGEPENILSTAIFSDQHIDESCSVLFNYHSKKIIASLTSTQVANTPVGAIIFGTEGNIRLNRFWHTPTTIDLEIGGQNEHFKFDNEGIGYHYEAAEVNKCISEGKTESDIFPLSKSLQLHRVLDTIRNQIGLTYAEDELSRE
jgi:predicted dehydrogenase